MVELLNLGLTEEEIKNIYETNIDIKYSSEEEIIKLIEILKEINCTSKEIQNIIVSNPFYLTRLHEDIIKLINILIKLGFKNLNLLFDTNPYLLDIDDFEIENFINTKTNNYTKEEIINMITSNPYIITEEI